MRNYIIGLVLLIAVVYSCANPGYPTGGPKDETPPKVKKSTPHNGAMNYKEDEVIIEFDEIIKLDNVNQKFVASPPLKERPKITTRGAKLSVKFEEELQENTTYTLDFADAVQDYNEGNPIESYVFSFSTGKVVDSMAILGHVWDADDLSPVEGALVMAHKNLADSAFTSDVPVRLAKTDSKGHFAIRNLSPGEYRVYTLDDANRNYMYDQPGEYVAWYDSIVSPSMEFVSMPDTLPNDSVVFHEELVHTPNDIKMFLFQEPLKLQYFKGEERKDSNKLSFAFNLPVEDFTVHPVGKEEVDWAIFEPSFMNDTISVWITDSAFYNQDTLDVAFTYLGVDSLKQPVLVNDTVTMYYFNVPKKETRRSKKQEKVEVKTLKVGNSLSKVDLYNSFNFTMPTPIAQIDTSAIKLYEYVDTLMNEVDFNLIQDTLLHRRYSVQLPKWTPGGKYLFMADSASIKDVYGLQNDSIGIQFSVYDIDSYSTMLISVKDPGENWLVQLLNGSDKVVNQKYVPKSGKFSFQYIKPGKYSLKLVVDSNRNGKWDSGSYKNKIQPEMILYYPDKVDLRASWDHVIEWVPADFDIYDFVSKNRKPKKRED